MDLVEICMMVTWNGGMIMMTEILTLEWKNDKCYDDFFREYFL